MYVYVVNMYILVGVDVHIRGRYVEVRTYSWANWYIFITNWYIFIYNILCIKLVHTCEELVDTCDKLVHTYDKFSLVNQTLLLGGAYRLEIISAPWKGSGWLPIPVPFLF